jgi:DNA-binding CsgD family transcriptional regulator
MRADAVSLIEAAYDVGADGGSWLRRVSDAAARLTSGRYGVSATMWSADGGKVSLNEVAVAGDPEFHPAMMGAIIAGNPNFDLSDLFLNSPPVGLASAAISGGLSNPEANAALADLTARYNAHDYVGVNGRADQGRGVVISFALVGNESFEARHERMWSRLAVHLGTGLRLHDRLAKQNAEPDAVLSPNGKLLHAQGDATGKSSREDLATATKTLDKVRGRLRTVDEDEAVSLWRALVRGEWSLVDRFDSDGQRFVVAHKNTPGAGGRGNQLSVREAHAAALLARGYSNKLIAYELGLPPSTVSRLLARACKALGVESNVELVRVLRAGASG